MSDRAAEIPETTYEAGFCIWASTISDEQTVRGAKQFLAFHKMSGEDAKLVRRPDGGLDIILKRAFTFNKREESETMSEENAAPAPRGMAWPPGTVLWCANDEPAYIEEAKAWVKRKGLTGDDVKLVKHAGLRVEIVAKREVRT